MAREPLKVLTESMFYVLLSLLRQERCGTEIVQYVDDATAGRVPLGPRAGSGLMPSRTGGGRCSGRS